MAPLIKPLPISGFPEFKPHEQILFQWALGVIRQQYERYGFVPIETPAVERTDVLLAKGGDDREIYGLRRVAAGEDEEDSKNLALHFDLTVPLARYVAQHHGDLTFPFRRYQIQPVWRGERPQQGRFRQFYQADIDVIGDGELSLLHDAEVPSVIHSVFSAMGIGRFAIRINNRKVVDGLLAQIGVEEENALAVKRLLDAAEKNGLERTRELLAGAGVSMRQLDQLDAVLLAGGGTDTALRDLRAACRDARMEEGLNEVGFVLDAVRQLGVPEGVIRFDPRIIRGLDYYTGTTYETVLLDHPGIGSICSGGRYDNLAGHFSARRLPGVGISIGVTRLMTQLIEVGIKSADVKTTAQVLVTVPDRARLPAYLGIAATLRRAGINTEVFLEERSLKSQMRYADRKGFTVVIVAHGDELDAGHVNVRSLALQEQTTVGTEACVEVVQRYIALDRVRARQPAAGPAPAPSAAA